jgi:hypothetical protein
MSNSLVNLLVKILSWGIMGISILIALLFFANVVNEELFILWAYLLVAIAAAAAIIFPIIFFASNPKNAVKALVGLGALGLVFLVGYLMADTTTIVTATSANEPAFSDPSVLRFADTGIISTYILFGIAVLSLLLTGIRSITKL